MVMYRLLQTINLCISEYWIQNVSVTYLLTLN
jgi:hypothetical protein